MSLAATGMATSAAGGMGDGESIAVNARVATDARAVLEARFGPGAALRARELLGDRLSVVVRAEAYAPGSPGPASVVVKHLPGAVYGEDALARAPAEFLEEAAAYAFFEELEPGFTDRPACWGVHPHGLLVLEDLGQRSADRPDLDVVGTHLARAFARLHAGTREHGPAYAAARARLGLTDEHDTRYDGVPATRRRFERGAGALAEWCEVLGVGAPADTRALVAPLAAAVETPGLFHALIHDDLANARQCVMRPGGMHLLDFENARWGHALRDLAKALVGKFERDLGSGRMVLMCPGFPPGILRTYRRELAGLGGPDVDEDTWGRAVADGVLYHTVVQIGSLLELMTWTEVAGQVLPNLRALVDQASLVIDGYQGHAELRRLLSMLMSRIV